MSTTISGTTGIDKVQDGTVINASSIMGALNATGTAPIYACRAWVNFNGTGTVAIRRSGNVSSITDNGSGDYTVNFTTAMSDAYYELNGACGGAVAGTYSINPNILTASSSRIQTRLSNYENTDLDTITISVVR